MIPIPWAQVPPNARVVLSSGRIVHVIATLPAPGGTLVRLRSDSGATRDVTMTSDMAPALVLTEAEDMIPMSLATRFPEVEFLRSL